MSEKKLPASNSAIWQLTASTAELHTSPLTAQVDLCNPLQGLHDLNYCATPVEGSVLGVARVGEDASVEEAFVRGDDLVATYRTANEQPFSLQVYWTVTPRENGVVVIDTLLSLETPLLENFPKVLLQSELPGTEVWQPHEGSDYLMLRSIDKKWSYAEISHGSGRLANR